MSIVYTFYCRLRTTIILLLAGILGISCASTGEPVPEGVVFITPTESIQMHGNDIYNVTHVQEDGGSYLITLWLGDPGIQKLAAALNKAPVKNVTLKIGNRIILNKLLVENISRLYRIQMRATDSKVANELIQAMLNARQGKEKPKSEGEEF